MGINNLKYRDSSAVKLIIMFFIILCYIISQGVLEINIEDNKRVQARDKNLTQIVHCFNELSPYLERKQIFDACAKKMSTGFTGDVYVLDSKTFEFIYETSRDAGELPKFFTKDSVGRYFSDWESGEKALKIMALGKDSTSKSMVSYLFDDAEEWVEWKYISDRQGEMIVVQGTQSDEALRSFDAVRFIMLLSTVLLSVSILINIGLNHRDIN